jgi:cell wall-associated NlpC family hydrolase
MAPDYEEDYAQFSDSDNMSFDELFKNITKKTSKVDKSITGEITEFKVPKASDETEDTYDYFQPSTTSNLISSIISSGRSLLGKKYLYGGTNPETGLDCSAFLQYIFKQNGINIPRDTSGIFKIGKEVSYKDIQPGDIICSRGSGQSGRHV